MPAVEVNQQAAEITADLVASLRRLLAHDEDFRGLIEAEGRQLALPAEE